MSTNIQNEFRTFTLMIEDDMYPDSFTISIEDLDDERFSFVDHLYHLGLIPSKDFNESWMEDGNIYFKDFYGRYAFRLQMRRPA